MTTKGPDMTYTERLTAIQNDIRHSDLIFREIAEKYKVSQEYVVDVWAEMVEMDDLVEHNE